ncbi:unnamed protein product [Rhizophagus irregularis]|nr:unnamed protein product [Rhizophagus irregularis]CAB4432396.1 unnamed protein product [Rhizophagus irregularis]
MFLILVSHANRCGSKIKFPKTYQIVKSQLKKITGFIFWITLTCNAGFGKQATPSSPLFISTGRRTTDQTRN